MINISEIKNPFIEDLNIARDSFNGHSFICTSKLFEIFANTFDIEKPKWLVDHNREIIIANLKDALDNYLTYMRKVNENDPGDIKAKYKIADIIKTISALEYIRGENND